MPEIALDGNWEIYLCPVGNNKRIKMTAMASVRSAPIPTVSAFAASPSISGEVNRHAELEVFVQVAERGGFSAAARLRGSTPSAISKTVARLEARLGVQLLRRSTQIGRAHV